VPKVVITGYHQLFPASAPAGCRDLSGIDASELAWGRGFQTRLNAAIKEAAAKYTFASYTDVDFTGHEICSADSWVQTLNDKEPFHPTVEGQQAYAKAVLDAVSSHSNVY
jgi:lysophospholipase L1-like esterase